MKCPSCNVNLVMTDRQGVEIDYCPECRGVWLDRGELDKILERSAAYGSASSQPFTSQPKSPSPSYNDDYPKEGNYKEGYRRDEHYKDGYYKKKKRETFLDDLFDF